MHLESLFEEIGAFGPFQKRLVLLLSCFKAIIVPTMLMMAFAGNEPDWWCEVSNSSDLIFRNGSYKNCEWNSTCERRYDDAMVTVVSKWDLVCDKSWIANTITSIQMAGVFTGAICSGYGSDTYGRKKMLYSGILLGAVGNLVAAFSVSWIMFTVLRFILGFAVGLSLSVIYLYMVEFVGTKWRGFVASLPSWPCGVVFFAGLSWLIRDWKWMHIAVAVLYTPFLLSYWEVTACMNENIGAEMQKIHHHSVKDLPDIVLERFVPESLRWLTVKGHLEDARHVVNRMAKVNKKPVPDTSILELISAEERTKGEKANNYSYLDLFKTRKLARRTFFTCFIWFSLATVYYSISFGVKNLSGDFYQNFMINAVIEIPSFVFVLILVYITAEERNPCPNVIETRDFHDIFSTCTSMTFYISPQDIKVPLENGLAITAKFFCLCAWAVSQAMTSEQFPTVVRNLAFAAQNTSARVGSVLAAQLLSLGGKNDLMPPFIAMGILMSLTALICFTLDETSKAALEDTMKSYTIDIALKGGTEMLLNDTHNRFSVNLTGEDGDGLLQHKPNGVQCREGETACPDPAVELTVDLSEDSTNKE